MREGGYLTVMDHIRARKPFEAQDIVKTGAAGVLCAEAGDPYPDRAVPDGLSSLPLEDE